MLNKKNILIILLILVISFVILYCKPEEILKATYVHRLLFPSGYSGVEYTYTFYYSTTPTGEITQFASNQIKTDDTTFEVKGNIPAGKYYITLKMTTETSGQCHETGEAYEWELGKTYVYEVEGGTTKQDDMGMGNPGDWSGSCTVD